jgi:hypothetical protein
MAVDVVAVAVVMVRVPVAAAEVSASSARCTATLPVPASAAASARSVNGDTTVAAVAAAEPTAVIENADLIWPHFGGVAPTRIPVIVATLDDDLEVADEIVAQGCIPADGQACPIPSVDAAGNE